MAINKQQRIWFAVLAVAAGAWATDRFILGGGAMAPSTAEASLLVTRDSAAPAPRIFGSLTRPATLNERLIRLAAQPNDSALPVRDVFSPPSSWLPADKPTALAAAPANTSADDFRHAHSLTAVVRAGRNSQIFMGERIVRLGQSIDGFRLLSVTQSSATFSAGGTQVTLELDENPANLSTTRAPDKTPTKIQ